MTDMDFTELVKRKIEERREGRSASIKAAAEANRRFDTRVAPLVSALEGAIERLSRDAMFANAMGRPEIAVRRSDQNGREGTVSFKGRAGQVSFVVCGSDAVLVPILPDWVVSNALDCEMAYGHEPIKGDLIRINDLILRVCDLLGEFFADICLSSASEFLQPEPGKRDSMKW
jgi:hypothetical protein